MSVAVNCPTPFLPIASLQLQHFQEVTRSFAQRHPIISSVFSNFRTLSVATGVAPLPARFSWLQSWRLCALLYFHGVTNCFFFSERLALRGFLQFACPSPRRRRTSDRGGVFRRIKRKFSRGAVPIQCCISPFNARKHRSEKGLEPYRQLR